MHIVGYHLNKQAVDPANSDKDAFARSAFNRYYYSAYLTIRDMLSKMDADWAKLSHASYSEILTGTIQKRLKLAKSRAFKNKDRILVTKIDKAIRSLQELSKLIEKAYGVRVAADYRPNEMINFSREARFSLRSISATEAHDWESTARVHCNSVYQAWSDVYG